MNWNHSLQAKPYVANKSPMKTWTWTFMTRVQDLQLASLVFLLGLEKTLDVLCWTSVYVHAVLGNAQEWDCLLMVIKFSLQPGTYNNNRIILETTRFCDKDNRCVPELASFETDLLSQFWMSRFCCGKYLIAVACPWKSFDKKLLIWDLLRSIQHFTRILMSYASDPLLNASWSAKTSHDNRFLCRHNTFLTLFVIIQHMFLDVATKPRLGVEDRLKFINGEPSEIS